MQCAESAKPVKAVWHMYNESVTSCCKCNKSISNVNEHLGMENASGFSFNIDDIGPPFLSCDCYSSVASVPLEFGESAASD